MTAWIVLGVGAVVVFAVIGGLLRWIGQSLIDSDERE